MLVLSGLPKINGNKNDKSDTDKQNERKDEKCDRVDIIQRGSKHVISTVIEHDIGLLEIDSIFICVGYEIIKSITRA